MKVCGVAVAMLGGHGWAPILSSGWKVNVGTILLVPLPVSSQLAGRGGSLPAGAGGVGRRTCSSPRSGKPVTWRRASSVFAAEVLIAEVAGEYRRAVARPG